jgi:tetratricopeptide (TPR) repeat protein
VLLEVRNKKGRALVDRALGADLSSMPVDDALNGRQSYSGAFELFSQVQPLKHTEEFVDILHVKARAIVPDKQLCLIFASVRTPNLDFGPFSYPRELNRIGEQVHKDDFQHGTDQALEIDPNDANALAGSAYTYYQDYIYGWSGADTDYEAKALGQANRANALAPDNLRAYLPKALYLSMSRRPNEALGATKAGLAINPNFVPLLVPRIIAQLSLGRFEQANADEQLAMRLSPRDPYRGVFYFLTGAAELSLGHLDAALDAYRKAIDSGHHTSFGYSDLSAAYALVGMMDEAKAALAEARRLNPKLTVKWLIEHSPGLPAVLDGVRKAGLPEE